MHNTSHGHQQPEQKGSCQKKGMLMQGEECIDIKSPNKRTVHIRKLCFVSTEDIFQYLHIVSSLTEVGQWIMQVQLCYMFIPTNNVHITTNLSNPKDEVHISK